MKYLNQFNSQLVFLKWQITVKLFARLGYEANTNF